MKWFKHNSDASDRPFMQRLEDKFGLEGYARWWKLIEEISKQLEKNLEPFAENTWTKWQSILRGKRNKLETFLEHCQNESRIILEQNGNVLKITCPKVLELRDNHTRHLQATDKQNRKKFPLDLDKEINPLPLKKGKEEICFEGEGKTPREAGTNPRAVAKAERDKPLDDHQKAKNLKYLRDTLQKPLDNQQESWLKLYESGGALNA